VGRLRVPDLTPSTRQESEVRNTTAQLQSEQAKGGPIRKRTGEPGTAPGPGKSRPRFQVPQTPPASPRKATTDPAAPMTEEVQLSPGARRANDRGRMPRAAALRAAHAPTAPSLPPVEAASVAGDTRGNPPTARVTPGFPRTPFPPLPPAQGRAPRATDDSHTAPTRRTEEPAHPAPKPRHPWRQHPRKQPRTRRKGHPRRPERPAAGRPQAGASANPSA
jgi:hypothetical protein